MVRLFSSPMIRLAAVIALAGSLAGCVVYPVNPGYGPRHGYAGGYYGGGYYGGGGHGGGWYR